MAISKSVELSQLCAAVGKLLPNLLSAFAPQIMLAGLIIVLSQKLQATSGMSMAFIHRQLSLTCDSPTLLHDLVNFFWTSIWLWKTIAPLNFI